MTMTTGELLDLYASELRSDGLRPATLTVYTGWPRRLSAGTGTPLTLVTEGQIRTWIGGQGWAPATHHRAVTALRRFFLWAYERGYRDDDPAARLRPARVSDTGGDPCPDDVLEEALANASGDDYWRIRIAAETGLRRSELAGLHCDQAALVGGQWWLRVDGKGGKTRRVPLSPPAAVWLTGLHGYAFPHRGGRMRPDSVGRWYRKHLGANVHSLRHRFAGQAYRNGHDLEAVRQVLGHSSVTTTQLYLHATDEDLVAAVSGAWIHDRRQHVAPAA